MKMDVTMAAFYDEPAAAPLLLVSTLTWEDLITSIQRTYDTSGESAVGYRWTGSSYFKTARNYGSF